jgi:APA family basic amino acid/polyamine antiporter
VANGAIEPRGRGFVRELGRFDATMIVAGSMIGSGIFIVPADIARQVGSPGGLLATWVVTGLLTVAAALAYGELAAMMPRAGGQYVYLREAYSPLWGFLYGWALFLVIQTGTIAAVAVAFARFLGVLAPAISPTRFLVAPIDLSRSYAVSLSTQQAVGVGLIVLLTVLNTLGIRAAKLVQNAFTAAKTLSLVALILAGVALAPHASAIAANFRDLWTVRSAAEIRPDFHFLPALSATSGGLGLVVALCVAQVGSLFSADAWNNIGFAAGEVKDARRDVALSMALGTVVVTVLYALANVAYLRLLPLAGIQQAADDRVATAALSVVVGPAGAVVMALAIIVSTFGCNNGLVLAGARVYYAMARDGLFFRSTARLNARHVPAVGLWLQCLWACALVLPRTRLREASGALLVDEHGSARYGNLYSNLLDYVVFSVLVFYILTIAGLFALRRRAPQAERPFRAWGYPWVPALYLAAAGMIAAVLILYRTQTTWPGLLIVLTGVPVYFLWRWRERGTKPETAEAR